MADRHTRWGDVAPRVVQITPRVIEVLKACDLIRYSRSSWLFAKINSIWPDADETNFLKSLRNIRSRALIEKVDTRRHLYNAAYQPDVYRITQLGRQTLYDAGIPLVHQPFSSGTFQHNLMVADVMHSINLGETVISQDRVLKDKDLTIKVGGQSLTPDAVFGIEYPDKSYRFFALECDRGTQPIIAKSMKRSSIRKKLVLYREVLSKQLYRQWSIPNFFPLFVTTSQMRLDNMKDEIFHLTGDKGNSAIMLKLMKGDGWRKPPPDAHMVREPWTRAGYARFYLCSEAMAFQ